MLRGAALVGAALVVVVVLLLLANAVRPDAVEMIFSTLVMWAEDSTRIVQQLARGASNTVITLVPVEVKPHVEQVLAGATSVVLIGHGLRGIPGIASPLTGVTNTAAFIMAQPVDKLFYALGGIALELLLLRLLVCPPQSHACREGAEKKASHACFTTHVRWLLLVASVAVPNGIVEAGFFLALLTRLPLETYTPALVVGKLLQPYVAAALSRCPWVMQWIQVPFKWGVTETSASSQSPFVEVAIWASVLATVLLLIARYLCAEPGDASGSAYFTADEVQDGGALVD